MSLIEVGRTGVTAGSGAPSFLTAGEPATGEFHCADCGYGIAVRSLLPVCPMCRGRSWDDRDSSFPPRSRG